MTGECPVCGMLLEHVSPVTITIHEQVIQADRYDCLCGQSFLGVSQTTFEEPTPCEQHTWRLNKHGRICVVCMKIEEGKGPKEP